jgi:basic membrane protein A
VANETESANQDYAIIDMWMNPSVYPTITSILFNENEGSALVGAIAGLMTTTNKVAIAAAYQNDMFDRFAGGYVFGANYTNPGIAGDSTHAAPYNCTVAYVGSDYRAFADIPAATVLAEGLYNVDDVDIIFAATGRAGLGVINTAKVLNETLDHPAWAIGVDSPQMYLGTANPSAPDSPTSVLTSMLKRGDVAVFDAIKNATTGSHVPGVWYGTVENGGLDYEIATELRVLPQSVLDEVDDFKTAIANGTITVPSTLYWT